MLAAELDRPSTEPRHLVLARLAANVVLDRLKPARRRGERKVSASSMPLPTMIVSPLLLSSATERLLALPRMIVVICRFPPFGMVPLMAGDARTLAAWRTASLTLDTAPDLTTFSSLIELYDSGWDGLRG
jgi:hypothetical protein